MKQLKVRPVDNEALAGLSELSPVFQRILAARGLNSVEQIDYRLQQMLSLDSIRNLSTAAELLADVVQENKQVLVFGDYDADGATSTALCIKALRLMGHESVEYLMPDRFIDGYGLSLSIAKRIVEMGPDCIITVDNGISSHDGIALLRAQNFDVIVTDHHLPAEELPDASVIVNQNAWKDSREGRNLAGVGVAFYLMLAVRRELRSRGWFDEKRVEPNLAVCLDLVAIGTVADLVPLDYHNRILVNEGLRRIRSGACSQGLKSLIEISGKYLDNFSSTDIAFSVAPRINAAGRLDDMTVGVQCLLSDEPQRAMAFASELNDINQLRKDLQQQMALEAQQQLKNLDQQLLALQKSIVIYQAQWHEGIVGIVASKLKENYHRPCIVFAQAENGALKGSGRSIPGIHLRDMLDMVDKRNPGAILKFGGHAMAAGLTLQADSFQSFRQGFEQVINEFVDDECFDNDIECDGELDKELFNLEFANALQNLSPWGQRFPMPSFVGDFQVLSQRVLGDKHLKLTLSTTGEHAAIDAIAFFQPAELLKQNHEQIRIHYELNVNRFRDTDTVQLLIRDFL